MKEHKKEPIFCKTIKYSVQLDLKSLCLRTPKSHILYVVLLGLSCINLRYRVPF